MAASQILPSLNPVLDTKVREAEELPPGARELKRGQGWTLSDLTLRYGGFLWDYLGPPYDEWGDSWPCTLVLNVERRSGTSPEYVKLLAFRGNALWDFRPTCGGHDLHVFGPTDKLFRFRIVAFSDKSITLVPLKDDEQQ